MFNRNSSILDRLVKTRTNDFFIVQIAHKHTIRRYILCPKSLKDGSFLILKPWNRRRGISTLK